MTTLLHNRDEKGKITRAAPYQSTLASGSVARVEPNRRWFGEYSYVLAACHNYGLNRILTLENG